MSYMYVPLRGTVGRSLEAPVCAALRLGLCIIQPLRGCTSYSVSAIQGNISYNVDLCRYCSFTRSKHPAVVSRRDTIMHNPRLRESSDRSLGLKSISYCASERYIHKGHGNPSTHGLVIADTYLPHPLIPTFLLLTPKSSPEGKGDKSPSL